MGPFVLGFDELDPSQVALVGGKGAHLGALARIDGVRVPKGFVVTTRAFQRMVADVASFERSIEQLSRLQPGDHQAIRAASAELRTAIEAVAIPDELASSIQASIERLGDRAAYAVRSSATAEDLPTASFAGQQDTYLNIVGPPAILQHVSRCWASLFSERAVTYRLRNGFDHRKVHMAVVVQQMVFPQAAGILFTADPVTFNRKITSVDASFGLGEALVSGLVNADVFKVRDGALVAKSVATKRLAIVPSPSGGTQPRELELERQTTPALTDAQVLRLAALGRRIEAHFGRPQDVEWCLVDDDFHVVQSRPITTLFPVPVRKDDERRVYLSVGHQQMMTDAMKPLGLSLFQLTAARPMFEAGGRLFVDVTQALASPAGRAGLLEMMGTSEPLFRDALQTLLDRGDFIPPLPDAPPAPTPARPAPPPLETDPAIVAELIARNRASLAALKREIETRSGEELMAFILADLEELKRVVFDPRSTRAIMAGMEATWWLNDKLQAWLGEKNATDTLTQSVPNNVTSEMGLALLDVADAIRPHPEVIAQLRQVEGDDFLDALPKLPGGREVRDAIYNYLEQYGMRCVGEIDLTRPRWSERPSALLPLILSNLDHFAPGEAKRRFERGLQEARRKEQEVLERLRALPDGEEKAEETRRMIDRVRTFIGYREYPKYGIISRYFVYKQALMREAERLVAAGVIREKEEIFFLTFQELNEVVRTQRADPQLLRARKEDFRSHQALQPPRVLTSEGEAFHGTYRRDDLPAGALVGLGVSAGTVEGRARVILDMASARLEDGDILVTAHTDPSWSPLFVAIKGLVTEIGGLMSHGTVIAREYGLPAVVGVAHATQRIRDGQRIRVHGTEGYVELLS